MPCYPFKQKAKRVKTRQQVVAAFMNGMAMLELTAWAFGITGLPLAWCASLDGQRCMGLVENDLRKGLRVVMTRDGRAK